MRVVQAAIEDRAAWLALAAQVEPLFGPMVQVPSFLPGLDRTLQEGRAFCIRFDEQGPGAPLLGGIMISTKRAPLYSINWLAVAREAQRQGVATALLQTVLAQMDRPGRVGVITFGADHPGGEPARQLYAGFGFVPTEEAIPNGPEGGSRQRFVLEL